jgi:exosome complex component RRP42
MKSQGYNVVKKAIAKYLAEGKRYDGRTAFELRDIEVKTDVSVNAESSVSVKIGETEVVAGIKMGLQEPYPDHENEGTMMTGIELLPMGSPKFDYGPPTIQAIETSRVIDRGIRESGFVDFKGLCIKPGEKVWNVFIDMAVINHDGNLLDAGALAAVIALRLAKMPNYDEKTQTIAKGWSDKPLPLVEDKMPITVTMHKVGEKALVDPTLDEESASEGRLTIEISQPKGAKEPMISAMQKGGEATLGIDEADGLIQEAGKLFKQLSDRVNEEVKKAQKAK